MATVYCYIVQWEAFSPPELRNFIEILNMEEEASITKVFYCTLEYWMKHILPYSVIIVLMWYNA